MKHLKLFESFHSKKYLHINNIVDNERVDFYQVPFSLGENDGTCLYDSDDWGVCISDYYVYDYILDSDIEEALKLDLSEIDVSKDWSYSYSNEFRYETAFSNKEKHILRVAKLVKEILDNKDIIPISMNFDIMSTNYDIKNHIEDGNHRIRALQFLKYDFYPAYIYGSHSRLLIEYLSK